MKMQQKEKIAISSYKAKTKNSKAWNNYRIKKEKILNYRMSSKIKQKKIETLKQKTYESLGKNWEEYRNTKFKIVHKTPFAGLRPLKHKKSKYSKQLWYSLKDYNKLDEYVKKFIYQKNIRYIVIVLKVKFDSGDIHYQGEVINKLSYERIISDKETEYNLLKNLLHKLKNVKGYTFELLSVSIRLIYDV